MGLAAAIVVAITMCAALTLVPSLMGVVKNNVRSLAARARAHREGISAQQQAKQTAAGTDEKHEHSAFARWITTDDVHRSVAIDASIVRMILVPAIMALLGKHAWWMPRWVEHIVPQPQLEGSAAAATAAAASGAGYDGEAARSGQQPVRRGP